MRDAIIAIVFLLIGTVLGLWLNIGCVKPEQALNGKITVLYYGSAYELNQIK